jgi:hypothetical protein
MYRGTARVMRLMSKVPRYIPYALKWMSECCEGCMGRPPFCYKTILLERKKRLPQIGVLVVSEHFLRILKKIWSDLESLEVP